MFTATTGEQEMLLGLQGSSITIR